jgi:hypothetical protein
MKPQDKTRELVQNMEFQAGQDMHDRIKNSIQTTSAQQSPQLKSFKATAYVAAAAIVLISISLMLIMPQRHTQPEAPLDLASSDILSMRSMHLAFHNDGLDGLEEYLDASLTQVGPRPTESLMQGLYENVGL